MVNLRYTLKMNNYETSQRNIEINCNLYKKMDVL